MNLANAAGLENQIPSVVMSDREALKIGGPALDPLTAADGFGGFLSTIFVVAAAGAVVFGLIASGSNGPLVLTLLGVFAMLGVFLVFGIIAGHVRIGARIPDGDVIKAAIEAGDDPIVISAKDGTVVYSNKAHEAMFGRSQGGPITALEATFSGDTEALQALFRMMRAAERAELRCEDVRLKASPQNPLRPAWLRMSVRAFASPQRDAAERSGHAALVLWTFTDITNEKNREAQKIGGLEAALASFDVMPAGFLSAGPGGDVSHINATFENWLGLAPGTATAKSTSLQDIAGADGARMLAELAREPDAERRVVDQDLTRDDGRIVPLTLYVEPAGRDGLTVTAINRALRSTSAGRGGGETGFSHFFHSAPFGIATLDGDGRIASANTAFMRMILDGRAPSDVSAAIALCRNAEPEERALIDAGLAQVLSGRGNVTPVEVTGGDNKQFYRRVYMSPLAAAAQGEAAALYVVDATEQKALEARFAQAQKMEAVGKLAGGIAHDFNNVLTAIIGFSDLLLQTHRPSDPAYKDIKNIQSSANRAAGLVANLLGFSRKQTQQVSVLNLGEVTTDLTPILRTSVGEKIELKIQSERDLWYVKADRTQIDNVIINLCVNARDAMPAGGKLTIKTRNISEREAQKMSHAGFVAAEYVLIEVEDTGTGMSADVMAKIFEPFFTTKGVGKGTGLGLASVYGVVKQSGGFIIPESEIGRGTKFKVYLPRHMVDAEADIEAAPKVVAKKPLRAVDLTGTGRVLLVEDEVEVRQFAVRALKRQGYEVMEAADGVEALELMRANPGKIDIVVSDVVMPEMDGPALFKELRKDNPLIKVIFVSGYPNEAFRETLGTEDFAFLPKPFSLPQLAEKVKEELAK